MQKKRISIPKELMLETKSGWMGITNQETKHLESFCEEYRLFISTFKTERQITNAGINLARKNGYMDLSDFIAKKTNFVPGNRFYHSISGKTLILGIIGKQPLENGMRIIGGHTDSPRLDLKPRPLYEDGGMALFDTHYYGGVRKYQWVTIPLAIHGVVIKKGGDKITISIGENHEEPVFVITDLLPHLSQEQSEKKLKDAITGEGLNVLVGSRPLGSKCDSNSIKMRILEYLFEKYGIKEADFTSAELSFVPAGPARDLGLDRSMILGYGHDDRVSAYTAMRALLDLKETPEQTCLCILCDKEEIGSVGSTGMYTFLFENTMAEIVRLYASNDHDLTLRRCLNKSKMLSADVNALHDPNYPDVSSPNDNMAKLNHGLVVTKYVGSRGKIGSNDAHAEFLAEIRDIFDKAKIIWQTGEIGKVDQGGGGTISHMMARYGMDVVDCGVGLLSMHAPWEVVGKLDVYMAYKGYCAFYNHKQQTSQ